MTVCWSISHRWNMRMVEIMPKLWRWKLQRMWRCENTLVGYVTGSKPFYSHIKACVIRMWKPSWNLEVYCTPKRLTTFTFNSHQQKIVMEWYRKAHGVFMVDSLFWGRGQQQWVWERIYYNLFQFVSDSLSFMSPCGLGKSLTKRPAW